MWYCRWCSEYSTERYFAVAKNKARKRRNSSLRDLIPGKDFEEAAANVLEKVGTDAGKTFIRGIAKLFGAMTAEYIARKEARADAVRQTVSTEARIDKRRALIKAKHNTELEEADHELRLTLARRRADRMFHEMAQEQNNLEAITSRALDLIESQPNAMISTLDMDWVLRFAEYAQKISDKEVQELWARILSFSATEQKSKMSPASLLLMSQLDRRAASDFETFCLYNSAFGVFPSSLTISVGNEQALRYLAEVGFVEMITGKHLRILNFIIEPNVHGRTDIEKVAEFEFYVLSVRGREICNAIFRETSIRPSGDDLVRALAEVIHLEAGENVQIRTDVKDQTDEYAVIWLYPRRHGEFGADESSWSVINDLENATLKLALTSLSDNLRMPAQMHRKFWRD
jgi:hypothetical protein